MDLEIVELIGVPGRELDQNSIGAEFAQAPHVKSESEIGHGLLTVSWSPGKEKESQTQDQVFALSLRTAPLSAGAKDLLASSLDEQLGWLTAAAERGCSLVVVQTRNTIEFYTTAHDRRTALRPVIRAMAGRVRMMHNLGRTRTLQFEGAAAARQLFRHAAHLNGEPWSTAAANVIYRASAFSAANAALGPTLASVFRAAANVARRVRQETSLQTAHASESLREIESFSAERIVEEELATWQAQEAEIERASSDHPDIAALNSSFAHQEPASEVRLRIGTTIKPRISYVLEPKRASS